ncbi:hypothetical protein [Caulobacter henricii]|uniref:SbsA Ig-like domain-containing protein n=1 Tax=Caulobacter henricii TaxID=69395 RepID=A0A0P0P0S5_9CAUL|nr:hypothetical protein [Caulobacter henricii]ALL14087.1 hypothetical protein AQ619_12455 [Caulobacter henricii]
MTLFAPALSLVVALAAGGGGLIQTREESTAVSPVTVMPPTLPPKVVATYPAEGQTLAPGVLILKVVFDQKMNPRAWSYAPVPGGEALDCIKTPRLLNDQKTFVLLCRVLSNRTYKVALNADPAAGGFANLADNRAEPLTLSFQVVRGEPVTSIARALSAAGLKSEDEPIAEAPKPPVRPLP